MAPGPSDNPVGADTPTIVGTGWSQVMIATVPEGATAGSADGPTGGDAADATSAAGADALALLEALPRTSGSWGSGRVLNGTLFSAILTDDGQMAIGAVTPETLGAALAAQ